jgi:hypothetical protein
VTRSIEPKLTPANEQSTKVAWDDHLNARDKELISAWTADVGPERLATIAAALTDPTGARGHPERPDSRLMLRMARLLMANPDRSFHSIAQEVADPEIAKQRSVELENLVTKLVRDFKKQEAKWLLYVNSGAPQDLLEVPIVTGPGANRALSRIIETMPEAIMIWGVMLSDARKRGPEALRLLKDFGRARAERSFEVTMEAMKVTGPHPLQSNRFTKMPRTMLDLIDCDLEAFKLERQDALKNGRK